MFKKIFIISTLCINTTHSFDESFGYSGKMIHGKSFDKLKEAEYKQYQPIDNPKTIKHLKKNPKSIEILFNKRRTSINASLNVIYPERVRTLNQYDLNDIVGVDMWEDQLNNELLYYTLTGEDLEKSSWKNSDDDSLHQFFRAKLREILILQNKHYSYDCCKTDYKKHPYSLDYRVEEYIKKIKENAKISKEEWQKKLTTYEPAPKPFLTDQDLDAVYQYNKKMKDKTSAE